jgi:hypothetical protein
LTAKGPAKYNLRKVKYAYDKFHVLYRSPITVRILILQLVGHTPDWWWWGGYRISMQKLPEKQVFRRPR